MVLSDDDDDEKVRLRWLNAWSTGVEICTRTLMGELEDIKKGIGGI